MPPTFTTLDGIVWTHTIITVFNNLKPEVYLRLTAIVNGQPSEAILIRSLLATMGKSAKPDAYTLHLQGVTLDFSSHYKGTVRQMLRDFDHAKYEASFLALAKSISKAAEAQ